MLLVSGSDDLVFYTVDAYTLQQHLPDAPLILYPDSAHGVHDQYPDLFLAHAAMFLDPAATASAGEARQASALLRHAA